MAKKSTKTRSTTRTVSRTTKATRTTKTKLKANTGNNLSLGDFLMTTRERKVMTQVQFAELLGMSKQNLCDIERGRRYVSPKTAKDFAKKLGFSANQLIKLSLQDLVNRDGIRVTVEVK